jgi:hypothetical protein
VSSGLAAPCADGPTTAPSTSWHAALCAAAAALPQILLTLPGVRFHGPSESVVGPTWKAENDLGVAAANTTMECIKQCRSLPQCRVFAHDFLGRKCYRWGGLPAGVAAGATAGLAWLQPFLHHHCRSTAASVVQRCSSHGGIWDKWRLNQANKAAWALCMQYSPSISGTSHDPAPNCCMPLHSCCYGCCAASLLCTPHTALRCAALL